MAASAAAAAIYYVFLIRIFSISLTEKKIDRIIIKLWKFAATFVFAFCFSLSDRHKLLIDARAYVCVSKNGERRIYRFHHKYRSILRTHTDDAEAQLRPNTIVICFHGKFVHTKPDDMNNWLSPSVNTEDSCLVWPQFLCVSGICAYLVSSTENRESRCRKWNSCSRLLSNDLSMGKIYDSINILPRWFIIFHIQLGRHS